MCRATSLSRGLCQVQAQLLPEPASDLGQTMDSRSAAQGFPLRIFSLAVSRFLTLMPSREVLQLSSFSVACGPHPQCSCP